MSHVQPRSITDVPALADIFSGAEAAMGFVPNSMLTMAHMPQLPVGFMMLVNVVFGGDLGLGSKARGEGLATCAHRHKLDDSQRVNGLVEHQ